MIFKQLIGSILLIAGLTQTSLCAQPELRQRPRYLLRPGDTLQLQYRLTPEFNQSVTVQPDGYVSLNIGGEVQVGVDTVSGAIALIRAGRLRALAVTSAKRSSVLPDVPTVAETKVLPDFDVTGWYGVLAPAGTPDDVVATLNRGIGQALASPAVIQKLAQIGADPMPGSPEQFNSLLNSETSRWTAVIKKLNLKSE